MRAHKRTSQAPPTLALPSYPPQGHCHASRGLGPQHTQPLPQQGWSPAPHSSGLPSYGPHLARPSCGHGPASLRLPQGGTCSQGWGYCGAPASCSGWEVSTQLLSCFPVCVLYLVCVLLLFSLC